MARHYRFNAGSRYPFGAWIQPGGVNFSVFSQHATRVELLLFDHPTQREPFQVIPLDPETQRTFFAWHVFVEALPPETHYAWRIDGPGNTRETGFRFNRNKFLVDPWTRAVSTALWDRDRACDPADTSGSSVRGIVIGDEYDWEGDQPLNRPLENSIIYEMHVGGFTRHPDSGVHRAGTFAGLIEKIPYLQELGITAVELLPTMAFDEQDLPPGPRNLGLKNYWGYSPHSFYSPHPGYSSSADGATQRDEFRDMVKALHRAGIGVILDVVFNHTAEGGEGGPTINHKGIGNEIFYHLDPKDRRRYVDYTGTGNTINCNHPLVSRHLVGCLEYWVTQMHVDGFRFDLASVMARGEEGKPMYHAPILWSIEFSDILAHTKLIAEAWDAGGLYQVGDFPGFRWSEWNGRYRDVIRRFVRGEGGMISEAATRIAGSADLYQAQGRLPINSINFVTCHDGFTLNDLVRYNTKHNEANGEDNRDGSNDNESWNCGVEGETDDPQIIALRRRQMKNFVAILLLSQGVPMLLSGDEIRRTQYGNNNAYCQDNEIGWFPWDRLAANRDMLRFVQGLIRLRRRHPSLMRRRFLTGRQPEGAALPDISWHGMHLNEPLWNDPVARVLGFTLGATSDQEADIHVFLNMSEGEVPVELPRVKGKGWCLAVDTYLPTPRDLVDPERQILYRKRRPYPARARSVVVFESRRTPRRRGPLLRKP